MGWTLVVSEDESFHREAIARFGRTRRVVGATGQQTACSLVRAVDVEQILVDALDDVGRQFLSILRGLPAKAIPDVIAVDPFGGTPVFRTSPTLAGAFTASESAA